MKLKYQNILLRDMIEADIPDYVRWFTTETRWADTDAPWELLEENEEELWISWRKAYEAVQGRPDDICRNRLEIEWNSRHVGWVSSYFVDENFEWVDKLQEGQTYCRVVGIDICEPDVWGHGIGTNALRAFMNYYFENGVNELYTQTWSGNARMIHCAEKIGFVECNRSTGTREVAGKKYDALTFRFVNDTKASH